MSGRNFESEYVFKEYPKWVTLADGSTIIANSADEEAVLTEKNESTDERDDLLEQARELGLSPHHKTGEDKLRKMIDEKLAEG
jgi:hypothetical protein